MLAPISGKNDPSVGSKASVVTIIEGREIVKSYGSTPVLTGATFTVGSGVTGLLGSNGAGKTTMFGMILGLHRPDSGSLSVLGLDPASDGHHIRGRIGYAPEHHNLPPDVAAHDLVRHISRIHGLPHRQATARASDALWQVGLGEERYRPIGTMSTGQRQRVKLAQAIAHDPALVLLDEPTDGLDPVQRDEMLTLIRRCGTEFEIDIILSSHLLEEVERVCDNAVILAEGRVAASGTLDELRGNSEGYVVEVDDDPADLVARLRANGLDVVVDVRRLTVTGDADRFGDRISAIVRDELAASAVGLRRLHPRRISLEDVFLAAGSSNG